MTEYRWKHRPEGSNWGQFGPDDQIGRMNLLTPQRRLAALREVTHGECFTLSLPLDYPGGNALFPLRREPEFHYERRGDGHNFNFSLSNVNGCYCDVVSDDAVTLFTQYSTQWDGLAHVGQMFDADGDGRPEKVYYNGFRGGIEIIGPDDAETAKGATSLGIDRMAASGVQGRGVLIDLETIHGRDRALVGYDGMMRAIEGQKAEIREGDFVCLHTGFADVILEMGRKPDGEKLHRSCAVLDGRDRQLLKWVTDSGIVAICADNFAVEAYPAAPDHGDSFPGLPLHNHCLFKLGVHLGELWYFTDLRNWLKRHGRTAFLLTAPALRLPRAVGSPVTPVATV